MPTPASAKSYAPVIASVIVAAAAVTAICITWNGRRHPAPKVADAWPCEGSSPQKLSALQGAWHITYSWAHGNGPGSVAVVIGNDGSAELTAKPVGAAAIVRRTALSPEALATLVTLVDETGLLCQTPVPRQGRRIYDIGRYSISLTYGEKTRKVYIDECSELPDPRGFAAVAMEIGKLETVLGEEVGWGPYGYTAGGAACTLEEMSQLDGPPSGP